MNTAITPWTVAWTGEDQFFVRACRYANGNLAICQPHNPGTGKPLFAKPHVVRQRKCIVLGLCEKPLGADQVSMSFDRMTDVGMLQVEPMLHRACAAIAAQYCPHLVRMETAGALYVREVQNYRVAIAKLTAAAVLDFTGEHHPEGAVCGHAKIQVVQYTQRDLAWVAAGAVANG